MTTRGGELSWWWSAAEDQGRRRDFPTMAGYQLPLSGVAPAPAPYQQPRNKGFAGQRDVGPDMYPVSFPRPRLRWTQELHDHFVDAVNELGGANKATPKAILNLMSVDGLTLYHLKSHLQKFRLGKTAKRLMRREFPPVDYRRRKEERVPLVNREGQGSSISTNAFHSNANKTFGAEPYGNLNLLVEPQAAVKNVEMAEKTSGINIIDQQAVLSAITGININQQAGPSAITAANQQAGLSAITAANQQARPSAITAANQRAGPSAITAVKVEKNEVAAATKPSLLPLFPPIPACGLHCPPNYSPEWPDFLDGGEKKPVTTCTIGNRSVDDYMDTLGYYASSDFGLTDSHESSRVSVVFGTFFDEVASFAKVDFDDLTVDDHNVVAMEGDGGGVSAGVANYDYPY